VKLEEISEPIWIVIRCHSAKYGIARDIDDLFLFSTEEKAIDFIQWEDKFHQNKYQYILKNKNILNY